MPNNSYERDQHPQKGEIRSRIISDLTSRFGSVSSIATLAGKKMVCVKEMLETGLISNETKLCLLEHDRRNANEMDNTRASLEKRFPFLRENTSFYFGDARNWIKTPFEIKIFNFDFEYAFSVKFGKQLTAMSKDLPVGTVLWITFVNRPRQGCSGEFFDHAVKILKGGIDANQFYEMQENFPHVQKDDTIASVMLACSALNGHNDYSIWSIDEYGDTTPMITFVVEIEGKIPPEYQEMPSFIHILNEWQKQYEVKKRYGFVQGSNQDVSIAGHWSKDCFISDKEIHKLLYGEEQPNDIEQIIRQVREVYTNATKANQNQIVSDLQRMFQRLNNQIEP